MANNKLYNRSYFCKRLREAGVDNETLVVYDQEERRLATSPERRWTVLCKRDKIVVTCYKCGEEFWFRFETPDSWSTVIKTQSMNVVADFVLGFGKPPEAPSGQ